MYMKNKNIREYLEREQQRLTNSLVATDVPGITDDRAGTSAFGNKDEAVAHRLEADRCLALTQRTREQISEVKRALEKVANGTYGLCDGCGSAIPPERLEVIPQTSLCLSCKAKRPKAY